MCAGCVESTDPSRSPSPFQGPLHHPKVPFTIPSPLYHPKVPFTIPRSPFTIPRSPSPSQGLRKHIPSSFWCLVLHALPTHPYTPDYMPSLHIPIHQTTCPPHTSLYTRLHALPTHPYTSDYMPSLHIPIHQTTCPPHTSLYTRLHALPTHPYTSDYMHCRRHQNGTYQ